MAPAVDGIDGDAWERRVALEHPHAHLAPPGGWINVRAWLARLSARFQKLGNCDLMRLPQAPL